MAETHKKAERDYVAGMKYKEIAEKYSVSLNTVKSWKQRHGWDRKKGAPKEERAHTKGGAPKGNKNAAGNRGGAAPKGNANAVRHGLFRQYLPDDEETRAIYDAVGRTSPLDLLWENIQIKFTAIVRAQRIMHVKDQDDIVKVLKKQEDTDFGTKLEWEYQFPWDRQAAFLTAQARAMTALGSLIKQYEEMCRAGWADEEQQLRLDKLKSEVAALNTQTQQEQVVFVDDVHE